MRRLNAAIEVAADAVGTTISYLVIVLGVLIPVVGVSVEFAWWAGLLLLIPGAIVSLLVWLYG